MTNKGLKSDLIMAAVILHPHYSLLLAGPNAIKMLNYLWYWRLRVG